MALDQNRTREDILDKMKEAELLKKGILQIMLNRSIDRITEAGSMKVEIGE